eukprot:scaffold670957_cov62-Prasinocladus_malaysianus.AAC.1
MAAVAAVEGDILAPVAGATLAEESQASTSSARLLCWYRSGTAIPGKKACSSDAKATCKNMVPRSLVIDRLKSSQDVR